VDGFSPKGFEDEGEIRWRMDFLRKFGYKLWPEERKESIADRERPGDGEPDNQRL